MNWLSRLFSNKTPEKSMTIILERTLAHAAYVQAAIDWHVFDSQKARERNFAVQSVEERAKVPEYQAYLKVKDAFEAAYQPKRGKRPDEQRHFYIHVRGAKYNNRQAAIQSCVCGEQVQLIREPNNPHDSSAILICRLSGQELGYMPHEVSFDLALAIDAGQKVRAEVDWINQPDEEQRRNGGGKFGAKYGFGTKIRVGLLK